MKFRLILSTLALTACLSVVHAAPSNGPTEVGEVELKAALVPSGYNTANEFVGYDNNDKVLFTVLGVLPSTCHQAGDFTYEVKGDEVTVHQKLLEWKDSGKICLQTKMPFAKDIEFNKPLADAQTYKLMDGKTGNKFGELMIGESPVSEPDSELYLHVTDARLWYDPQAKSNAFRVVVVGMYNPDCTKLKELKVDVLEKERAIVARPILERIPGLADDKCEPTERIQRSEVIPYDLKGIWLLHVRSVQGAGKHDLVETDSFKMP